MNGHDLERTKKMFGTAYFVAKVEPLIVKYGQILLLEEGRVWMLGMPIRIQIQESLLTILVILTDELKCRLAKIIFSVLADRPQILSFLRTNLFLWFILILYMVKVSSLYIKLFK